MAEAEVLDRLNEMGLHLSVHGEKIWVEPKAAVTNEARRLILANKPRLLTALHRATDGDGLEAAREAAEERAAIVEYEGGFSRVDADIVAALAQGFYNHLFGPARKAGCCYAPGGRYCPEGERLRSAYYTAARRLDAGKRAE